MRARLAKNLAALDILALRTAQQRADIVARLTAVQKLAEHLDARNDRLLRRADADDLDLFVDVDHALLDSAGATVPRPEIENTSSTGIRNGLSFSASAAG
jgi:hypothetical protein